MSSRSGEIGDEAKLGEDRGEALRSQGCNEDIQGSSPPSSVPVQQRVLVLFLTEAMAAI